MKILINIPSLSLPGGVANHYRGLLPYWTEDVQYNVIGKRGIVQSGSLWLLWDIVKFIFKLIIWQPDIVILNPSLRYRPITRDTFFLKIALFFHKKIIVLIHGWDKRYADELNKKKFARLFNKAATILVLAKEFRQQLIEWGITTPVYLTTTKVDDSMALGFDINSRSGDIKTFLFLSRVEVEKGIFITIDIFSCLKKIYPQIKLRIVGGGTALNDAKEYVSNKNLSQVVFTGPLSGQSLTNEFENADIYILPTFHGEGMPTSVLEAMAFGLPVITRPVGGLADFFENSHMGFLIESLAPEDYFYALEQLINAPEKCKEISLYNHFYAKEHFLASKVARSIENYAQLVLINRNRNS